jgi:hypothetical protein
MKTWLWSLALAGCVLIAAPAARAAASPTPTPAPNETDLSDFKNNYRGSAKVSVRGVAPYRGRTKIRFTPRAKTAATVTIKAWIESDAGRFRVDDTIAFARNGIVRGKNLAPGVVTRAPFEGTYTATTTSIHFHGTSCPICRRAIRTIPTRLAPSPTPTLTSCGRRRRRSSAGARPQAARRSSSRR